MLLTCRSLSVQYGTTKALDNVSVYLSGGEIVALIGPNGAGKSTVLLAVSGLLSAVDGVLTSGEITIEGKSANGVRTEFLARMGVTLVPQNRHLFNSLSVIENLEIGAFTEWRSSHRIIKSRLGDVLDLFPSLRDKMNIKAGSLSGGEQQLVALGRALMGNPRILMLDEPTASLSLSYARVLMEKLVDIRTLGVGVLLVEQRVQLALNVCQRAYILDNGCVVREGKGDELMSDPGIKTAYLGIE